MLIKDYNFYGEHGNIETEQQLINEICRMSMMVATSYSDFYNATNNKILLMEDFLTALNKNLKGDLEEGCFIHNLVKCACEVFDLNSTTDVFIKCIDRFAWYLEEDGTQIVYSVKDAIELLEEIDNKLVMPVKWFSPALYKQLGEFLKTLDCIRTKHKGRVAFESVGEFTNTQILQMGKQLNGVSLSTKFDFFPTPDDLVQQVQSLAELSDACSILEPSAGTGSLLKGLDKNYLECVEMNTVLSEILKAKGYKVFNNSFEEETDLATYDRILMNPPFSNRLDAKHIVKAFNYLKEGGILVAIHSSSIISATDKSSKEFQQLFETYGVTQIAIDSGAFKNSGKGTMINTYITKFKK